ncbi:cupin domain-containing protein, partial [Vibrio parahaemolyticus]
KGRLTIEFDDGEQLELAQGDLASVAAGRASIWTVHEPFLKFVVNTQG